MLANQKKKEDKRKRKRMKDMLGHVSALGSYKKKENNHAQIKNRTTL